MNDDPEIIHVGEWLIIDLPDSREAWDNAIARLVASIPVPRLNLNPAGRNCRCKNPADGTRFA